MSSATSGGLNADLERSITPNRGTESVIDSESIEDYLKFPDPNKYLIGFVFGVFKAPSNQNQISFSTTAPSQKRASKDLTSQSHMRGLSEMNESMTTRDSKGYGKSAASGIFAA